MPHVFPADREALAAFLEREGRPAPSAADFVHESVWADFLRDRQSWEPIAGAPVDGRLVEVLYDNLTSERGVYWAETRQCMLGSRAGEKGPGWVSTEAGDLPVGDGPEITHHRAMRKI